MLTRYEAGQISLVSGSNTVTGFGTSWLTYVKPGDILNTPAGEFAIQAILSVFELQLSTPYTGDSADRISYHILIS